MLLPYASRFLCVTASLFTLIPVQAQVIRLQSSSTNSAPVLCPVKTSYEVSTTAEFQGTVVVPVFFHVVTDAAGVEGYVPRSVIEQQIAVLDAEFAAASFDFELAGISYTRNGIWFTGVAPGTQESNAMRQALNIDPSRVLNIYTVQIPSNSLMGFATYPWDFLGDDHAVYHSVIMDYRTLPGMGGKDGLTSDHGDWAVHEAGHYFGLYHTFAQGDNICGRNPPGSHNCATEGDRVCDTRPHLWPAESELEQCNQEACDGDPAPNSNHMNYTSDNCRNHFTTGQRSRMKSQTNEHRPTLVNASGSELVFDNGLTIPSSSTYYVASGMTIRLGANKLLTVEAGATLVLEPGVRVEMESNAQIAAYGRIEAVGKLPDGTYGDPIRFVRADPAQKWKEITLLASGNVFDNVVLDGGNQNLVIASKNNTLRNVRSRNGWRNLSTWYDNATGTRSKVSIVNSVFESATSVGVVMQHIDAEVVNSTIQTSAQAGLYATNASVTGFKRNVVQGNGTSSLRSGVELQSGGFLMTDGSTLPWEGHTRITGNAHHEVYVTSSGEAFLGDWDGYGGFNSIFDLSHGPGVSEKLVYNGRNEWLPAFNNFWGGTNQVTDPGYFYGLVDYDLELYTDPTAGSGANGDVPNSAEADPVMVAEGDIEPLSTPASSSTLIGTNQSSSGNSRAEHLRAAMSELRSRLSGKEVVGEPTRLLRELHLFMLRDHNDALGQYQANLDVLRGWSGLLSSKPGSILREAAEAAATLEVWEALRAGNYEEAARLVDQYTPLVEGADVLEAIAMQRVALLERSGRFGEALHLIAEVREARVTRARRQGLSEQVIEAEAALLTTREETIEQLQGTPLWPGAQQAAVAASPEANAAAERADEVPQQMIVRVQPNPFSGQTVIRYALAEQAHVRVEVFDMMGRRVALVVDEAQVAGTHEATFGGAGLSNGTYFYRVTAPGQTRTGAMLLVM